MHSRGAVRKHSSRMRITRLLPVHVSAVTTRCQYQLGLGVGPQANKFGQVSSDDRGMSRCPGSMLVRVKGVDTLPISCIYPRPCGQKGVRSAWV